VAHPWTREEARWTRATAGSRFVLAALAGDGRSILGGDAEWQPGQALVAAVQGEREREMGSRRTASSPGSPW
jgi:hypothetical protein